MKIRILVTVVIFAFSANLVFPQQYVKKSTDAPIMHNSQVDSLTRIVEQLKLRQIENERYFEIVQRTNDQLSLWWNPYGVMISTLGVLFAVLAIIATFIVFRQSANYRSILNESLQSYQNIINKFLEDKKIEIAEKVKELEEKLTTADKKSKKDIQETLDGLKRQREYIDTQVAFTPTPIAGSFGTFTGIPTGYAGYAGYAGYGSSAYGDKQVNCPHCGTIFKSTRPLSPLAKRLNVPWFDQCPNCKKQVQVG
jgi:hypothetical protein